MGIKFTVDIDPKMCYVKQKSQSYSKETIGVLYVFFFLLHFEETHNRFSLTIDLERL